MEQSTCQHMGCGNPLKYNSTLWCNYHTAWKHRKESECYFCGVPVRNGSTRCRPCSMKRNKLGLPPDRVRHCKHCGDEIKDLNMARGEYCRAECMYTNPVIKAKMTAPRNQVTKHCPNCRQDFNVSASNASRYNFCSLSCAREALSTTSDCKRCGKTFTHPKTTKRSHCSEECYRPAHYFDCLECGKRQRATPSTADNRRFCDNRCYRRYTGETSIEAAVREVIESTGLFYSQEEKVGSWVVDFLVLPNIVIEADGDYWHQMRPEVDARKTAELEALGYSVIRLWESDIVSGVFRKPLLKALRKGVLV